MGSHLDWVELRDFTGGLHTAGDWLMPANAGSQMLDCYPQANGGLRAFAKWETKTTDGITTANSSKTLGFFVWGPFAARDGSPEENSDFFAVTLGDDSIVRIHRLDESERPQPAAWSLIHSMDAGTNPIASMAQFVQYKLSGGDTNAYMAVEQLGAGGLVRIQYSDGVVSDVDSHGANGALVAHQSRLMVVSSASIRWTEPGTENFGADPDDNVLEVEPNIVRPRIVFMIPYAPADLLIGKEGSPFFLIQGDIEDPSGVRKMADLYHPGMRQVAAETPEGVAYHSKEQGMMVTSQGVDVGPLAPSVAPSDFDFPLRDVSLGVHHLQGNFLLTPAGLVYDVRTKAWFRTSAWGANAPGKWMAPDVNRLYVLTQPDLGGQATLYHSTLNEGSMGRMSTYTYTSPPLHGPEAMRQIRVREVNVVLRSYAAGASCTVTVGGVARTATGIGSGRQSVRFPFSVADEVLDVTVAPDSGADGTEAPSIEAIYVGTQAGHLLG